MGCFAGMIARGLLCGALLWPLLAVSQVRQASEYLQRMDANGDGRVSDEEYLEWMLYAFDQMDRNGNGILEPEEQPGSRGKPITRQQQQQVILERFSRQDANQDGFLDEQELMAPPR